MRDWYRRQWEALEDGESRIVFPSGVSVFVGLRRNGDWLDVTPGAFVRSFSIRFG